MKKLSLILLLAVIAVALVALMVACDPPGSKTQQVYFNSNNSDIALLYEQGTTNSPSTVLNSGESATFDVAIANKYDPATLTATAKNAKVSLKVTGSVDSAAMIENGYTVVGKLTISDITGTAEINFSAEEAEIAFTFKLSDNATEADAFLSELVLSDETTLAEAVNEEGYTYNLTYSEYAGTANQGIIVGGATKGLLGDTFSWVIVLFLVLGAVVSIAAFLFPKLGFLQAVAPVFYGVALGLIFLDGIEVISYGLIGIDNDVGGQMSLTMLYLILGAVSLILSIAAAFFDFKKKNA